MGTLPNGKIRVREADASSFPSESEDAKFIDRRQLEGELETMHIMTERDLQEGDDNGDVIDVMCLYTPEALCGENNEGTGCDTNNIYFIATMTEMCELAMQETNTAFNKSGVLTSVNLVHSGLIASDYIEEELGRDVVAYLRTSDDTIHQHGVYQNVRALRDEYNADLVTLIVNKVAMLSGGNTVPVCGVGSVFNGNSNSAYSAVLRGCATGYYSIAHEIGKGHFCNSW